ncbi:hypothetical protein EI94DRAFT_1579993 [Lactarius quietus]|nr:hypothetical protein EI94DRAFT_1579993 [Lactarius quietus]
MASATPSKRWTQFYAALQLAIQSAAHKWTHKDFTECFPLWCEEQPNGAEGVFKTVSSFIETHIIKDTNKLFEQYDVQKHIDELHGVVTEARARRQRGEPPGADLWREDLQPREAVRARTTTTLERERDMLRARLAQMEKENTELYSQIKENEAAEERTEARIAEIFAFFDEIYAKWQELPLEDMQTWTLLTAETQSAINPSI